MESKEDTESVAFRVKRCINLQFQTQQCIRTPTCPPLQQSRCVLASATLDTLNENSHVDFFGTLTCFFCTQFPAYNHSTDRSPVRPTGHVVNLLSTPPEHLQNDPITGHVAMSDLATAQGKLK